MVKRDKRNIGKFVRINHPGTVIHGRFGKIISFRAGDRVPGDPYVFVGICNLKTGAISHTLPLPGSRLEIVEKEVILQSCPPSKRG